MITLFFTPIIFAAMPTQPARFACKVSCRSFPTCRSAFVAGSDFWPRKNTSLIIGFTIYALSSSYHFTFWLYQQNRNSTIWRSVIYFIIVYSYRNHRIPLRYLFMIDISLWIELDLNSRGNDLMSPLPSLKWFYCILPFLCLLFVILVWLSLQDIQLLSDLLQKHFAIFRFEGQAHPSIQSRDTGLLQMFFQLRG